MTALLKAAEGYYEAHRRRTHEVRGMLGLDRPWAELSPEDQADYVEVVRSSVMFFALAQGDNGLRGMILAALEGAR